MDSIRIGRYGEHSKPPAPGCADASAATRDAVSSDGFVVALLDSGKPMSKGGAISSHCSAAWPLGTEFSRMKARWATSVRDRDGYPTALRRRRESPQAAILTVEAW